MLVAAAVCPHPPLLIPEAMGAAGADDASQADAWIADLRAACRAAVAALAAPQPDVIAVVGGGPHTAAYPQSACGSLHGLGIPFGTGTGPPVLPLSLTIGAWLIRGLAGAGLEGAGPAHAAQPSVAPVCSRPAERRWALRLQAVGQDATGAECARCGIELAEAAARVSLLVMGDGTARRATGVPGAADPQADAYDARVTAALAAADTAALARLDPALDAGLLVAGRPAWQALAGAAGPSQGRFHGRVTFAAAPLGVSYLVAIWEIPGPRGGSARRGFTQSPGSPAPWARH